MSDTKEELNRYKDIMGRDNCWELSHEEKVCISVAKLEELVKAHKEISVLQRKMDDLTSELTTRRTRDMTAFGIISRHVSDFYNNISLPGVRYMGGETGRFDRYLWVFILILGIFVTSKYIEDAYKKWQESPTLLSFNDSLTPIGLVPFPAVTLCPPAQLARRYDLDRAMVRCSDQLDCNSTEWHAFQAARLLCPAAFADLYAFYFRDPFMKYHLGQTLRKVVSHCDDHFSKMSFPDVGDHPCYKNLQTTFVGEKVCFTFNMLPENELFRRGVLAPVIDRTAAGAKPQWSPDSMLEQADLYDTVPRHVDTNGERDQLMFVFNNGTDQPACRHSYCGIKIALHSPSELPSRQTHKFYSVPADRHVLIRLTPHLVTAERQLRKYSAEKRKCHFSAEQRLALFSVYSQRNCQHECFVNCTLSVCGCVPFHMPRLNENLTLCSSLLDRHCLRVKLQGLIRELWWQSTRPSQEIYRKKIKVFYSECLCDCPPDCTTISYDADFEQLVGEDHDNVAYGGASMIRISFQNYEFTSVVRKELIGLTDFIANSGGVLGVFTGFSFVALVELIYYLTLRLWTTVKHAWDEDQGQDQDRDRDRKRNYVINRGDNDEGLKTLKSSPSSSTTVVEHSELTDSHA